MAVKMIEPGCRERILIAAAVVALSVVPILLAPFPPAVDLPQHLAQIRLFNEALADPGGPYVIQWLAPNNLIYVFLWGLWAVVPLGLLARAALVLIVLLWAAAIHGLAAGRLRGTAPVVVASLLIFNQSFYWGFLNFLIGFPAFVLWFTLTTREPRSMTWKSWAALAGSSVLLYGSHALWFAAGAAWLVLTGVVKKVPLRAFLWRLSALIPCGLLALAWYPRLWASRATAGFDTAAYWSPIADRLGSLMQAAFGGIRGPTETVAFIFVFLWAALSVWQHRDGLGSLVDRDLLAAGIFFLAIVAVAPDMFMNTLYFAPRWFPPAAILLLLALPAPTFRRLPPRSLALAVFASFTIVTAVVWRSFETKDLAGFRESLERIPPCSRVLGLDLLKESDRIKGRPFLQLFAYSQVFKGGSLNFSFAQHYSGLVAYRTTGEARWTSGLEWHGEKVQRTDFEFFDFVLVNADDKDHQTLSTFREIVSVTRNGPWRLYKVRK